LVFKYLSLFSMESFEDYMCDETITINTLFIINNAFKNLKQFIIV